MNTTTQTTDQLYGRDVTDADGNKLGTVDGVWVDDATGDLEFIGVKTGWFGGKTHIMPATTAQVGGDRIQVPYRQDQIKNSPTFGTDDEFSPEDEDRIYSHYGVDRSTTASPSGLPGGADADDPALSRTSRAREDTSDYAGTTDYTESTTRRDADAVGRVNTTGQNDRDITLSEERLQVDKRQVESGRARIRKVVRTEHVEQPVELRREEVNIERVSASAADVPADAFEEREINVPVMREEPVVQKEAHVTGRVQVNRDVQTETRNVEGEVRKEDVETDRGRR